MAGMLGTFNNYLRVFNALVGRKNLNAIYPQNSPILQDLAQRAPGRAAEIRKLVTSDELAKQLVTLSLYRLVILLDDSGSMKENGGTSIATLKCFLKLVVKLNSVYQEEGLSIRWLNSPQNFDFIKSPDVIDHIIAQNPFNGPTRLGNVLNDKVVHPFVRQLVSANSLPKPVIVLIISDGEPMGEPENFMQGIIYTTAFWLRGTRYGERAVEYQFGHVGNRPGIVQFLQRLDRDPQIGHLVDVTSEEGIEAAEVRIANGDELGAAEWVGKIMLGAIDELYDGKDEPPAGQQPQLNWPGQPQQPQLNWPSQPQPGWPQPQPQQPWPQQPGWPQTQQPQPWPQQPGWPGQPQQPQPFFPQPQWPGQQQPGPCWPGQNPYGWP